MTPIAEPPHAAPYDAVVLAGGAARRLGGADKPGLTVAGRPLLDRVLDACAGAGTTVVVGPRRPTERPVRWAREDPPGGGPLPALAAGLRQTGAGTVLVFAADLPFLTPATAEALRAALHAAPGSPGPGPGAGPGAGPGPGPGIGDGRERDRRGPDGDQCIRADGTGAHDIRLHGMRKHDVPPGDGLRDVLLDQPPGSGRELDGVVLTDPGGRDQPLAGAYRTEALRQGLGLVVAEHGTLHGLPLRLLTVELVLGRLPDPTGTTSFDCDTWEDVAVARARLEKG